MSDSALRTDGMRMSRLERKTRSLAARWVLVPCAAFVAYIAGLYALLFLLLFFPFPPALAEPTGSFAMGFLVVFVSGIAAPSHRIIIGIVALAVSFALSCFWRFDFILTSLFGSVCGLALIAWWFHPRRTPHSVVLVGRVICVSMVVYVLTVYGFHKDWFARASDLPYQLKEIVGTNNLRIDGFYMYDRGGFIDHEWLWRIDAKPETLAHIASALGLGRTNNVPRAFLRLPPHYWPRSVPAGGEVWQSRFFSPVERGPDGNHYLLLLDKSQQQAFVWVKYNF